MLRQILNMIQEQLDKRENENTNVSEKFVELVEEINELEEEYIEALADVERWGDIKDKTHWRTVELNKVKRKLEAKRRMLDTLKYKI